MTSRSTENHKYYLDTIEVLIDNFLNINSIDDIYTLLSEKNLRDITTQDDIEFADQYAPVPTRNYLFHLKNIGKSRSEVEVFFLPTGELINIRVQIVFTDTETGNEESYGFSAEELIPFIRKLLPQSDPEYNPPIYNPVTGNQKIEGMLIRYKGIVIVVHKLTGTPSIST